MDLLQGKATCELGSSAQVADANMDVSTDDANPSNAMSETVSAEGSMDKPDKLDVEGGNLESAGEPEAQAPDLDTTQQSASRKELGLTSWIHFAGRKDVWLRVLSKVVRNPVLWGIVGGFILSLSTLGPDKLNPNSDAYVPGFGWFWETTGWLGDCVSPVSLFAMGVWMESQGKALFNIPIVTAVLFMLSKLVLVPLVMVALAHAYNLNDEAGRAAVLIAALPISMASFSLGSNYTIGEAVLSENVALGTLLLLPTILIWNLVMDAIDLYPLAKG